MIKAHTCVSLDVGAMEEVKRQGWALSTLLNKLLSDYLYQNIAPSAEEAERLAAEALQKAEQAVELRKEEETRLIKQMEKREVKETEEKKWADLQKKSKERRERIDKAMAEKEANATA